MFKLVRVTKMVVGMHTVWLVVELTVSVFSVYIRVQVDKLPLTSTLLLKSHVWLTEL